ncbi:MAG: rpoE 1 [Planctomycetaceae bacterium]|nr:rpoE 1 [Planctomycetaceae bacterium]
MAPPGNSPSASFVLDLASIVTQTDTELIAECLQGRTEAFGTLVSRYQDRLLGTLVTMLGSVEDARDVAQEAFVQAYQKLESFRGQSQFYSWLFRIALNSSVDHHRRQRRPTLSIDAAREQTGAEPADLHPEISPTFGVERTERQALVQLALSKLSPDYRQVLVLKEMEDLKYDEIAELVKIPVGTVRSRIHRGRAELKAILEELLGDQEI